MAPPFPARVQGLRRWRRDRSTVSLSSAAALSAHQEVEVFAGRADDLVAACSYVQGLEIAGTLDRRPVTVPSAALDGLPLGVGIVGGAPQDEALIEIVVGVAQRVLRPLPGRQ